jgi:hypothetical protein
MMSAQKVAAMFSPIIDRVPDEIAVEPAGAGYAVIIPLTATDDGL